MIKTVREEHADPLKMSSLPAYLFIKPRDSIPKNSENEKLI